MRRMNCKISYCLQQKCDVFFDLYFPDSYIISCFCLRNKRNYEKNSCSNQVTAAAFFEDIPGVGKTTLAVALSKALSLDYKRLQFTPDVLPTDVTGFTILNKETHKFEYKQGAALTNLFLADEINRTSSTPRRWRSGGAATTR